MANASSDEVNEVRITDGHIGSLRQDPNNARLHPRRNLEMIERSLIETGPGRSVTADKNGVLITGNGVVEAAANAGIEEAIYVHTRGERLIVHVRDDLDMNETVAQKMSMYDNRTAELAVWDADILAGIKDTDILASMFTEEELRGVIEQRGPREKSGEPTPGGGGEVNEVFTVLVVFASESEQMEFLVEMDERGYSARAEVV